MFSRVSAVFTDPVKIEKRVREVLVMIRITGVWSYYRSDDIVNKVLHLVRISKEIDNKAF